MSLHHLPELKTHLSPEQASQQVAWTDVASFVRQLAHDVRNDLNALELEIALLAEPEPGTVSSADNLAGVRTAVRSAANRLRHISSRVDEISLRRSQVSAADLLEIIKEKVVKNHPLDRNDRWQTDGGATTMQVDIYLLADAIVELVTNAFQSREKGRPIEVISRVEDDTYKIEIFETKQARPEELETWGGSPFARVRRGHYGLGLFFAARIIAAHGASIERSFHSSSSILRTSIGLPLRELGTTSVPPGAD